MAGTLLFFSTGQIAPGVQRAKDAWSRPLISWQLIGQHLHRPGPACFEAFVVFEDVGLSIRADAVITTSYTQSPIRLTLELNSPFHL